MPPSTVPPCAVACTPLTTTALRSFGQSYCSEKDVLVDGIARAAQPSLGFRFAYGLSERRVGGATARSMIRKRPLSSCTSFSEVLFPAASSNHLIPSGGAGGLLAFMVTSPLNCAALLKPGIIRADAIPSQAQIYQEFRYNSPEHRSCDRQAKTRCRRPESACGGAAVMEYCYACPHCRAMESLEREVHAAFSVEHQCRECRGWIRVQVSGPDLELTVHSRSAAPAVRS
jgi:hypothetical protein